MNLRHVPIILPCHPFTDLANCIRTLLQMTPTVLYSLSGSGFPSVLEKSRNLENP